MRQAADILNPGSIETLRQFCNWWWREGRPYAVPEDCVRAHPGSHEFVIYRHGQFQVEQITLFPDYEVVAHCHPNVRTYECHLMGGGVAELEIDGTGQWKTLPYEPDQEHHVMYRRLLIEAGQYHRGVAHVVNVALSFQQWLNEVPPMFITDDWEQAGGGRWGEVT